jgi:hypothetical protein
MPSQITDDEQETISSSSLSCSLISKEEETISNSSLSCSLLSKVTAENERKDSKRLRDILPELSSVSNNADLSTVMWNVVRQ